MRKKKVLICGATGFIGRNLLERFKDNEKYEVTALHHKRPIPKMYTNGKVGKKNNVHWTRANLTKAEDVKKIMKGINNVIFYYCSSSIISYTDNAAEDIIVRDDLI